MGLAGSLQLFDETRVKGHEKKIPPLGDAGRQGLNPRVCSFIFATIVGLPPLAQWPSLTGGYAARR
jgi:hypothetical protein